MAAQDRPAARSVRPALWAGLLVLVPLAGYSFLMAPPFRLTRIEVTGVQRLSADHVRGSAGLPQGSERWRYPPALIRQRLLEKEPWIGEATVVWSGNTLQITVQEREPVALVPYYHLFLLVDSEGTILELTSPKDSRLPMITGVSPVKALRGERLSGLQLSGALMVAQRLPPELRTLLSEIYADPTGDLTLIFEGPRAAILGPPVDLEEKLLALVGVYPEARRENRDIDLRNSARPTLRLRDSDLAH